MDRISDLALDLGLFELDNERETGMERSQRPLLRLAPSGFRAIHQAALKTREKAGRAAAKSKRKS